jgi:hypothetical protein
VATAAVAPPRKRPGGRLKIEDLLGKRVKYKGEEGRVVQGHVDEQTASVVVSIRRAAHSPSRHVTVPEREWQELEILE